jgi:hypothetical protein
MFRVTFLVDDPAERERLATDLRALTMGGDARIVSAFADAKSVEVYLDIAESAVPRAVADRLAQWLGVSEYEVTPAQTVPTEKLGSADTNARQMHLRRAAITQVRAHPDGRSLSVQARHRRHETVESVEVEQTDDAVALTVLVGTSDDDVRGQFVSLGVAFTWVDTFLDRPLGDRRIIRHDPE